MRNRLGQLDREAEVVADARCPTLVRRATMRPVKGCVDLDRIKPRRIALEMRSIRRERLSFGSWDAPARGSNPRGQEAPGRHDPIRSDASKLPG